jgi:hypothetical protein
VRIQSSHGIDGHYTPSSVSPASSFGGSSQGAMNDSQNTLLTEPDDVPGVLAIIRVSATSVPPTSYPMTQEELRQVCSRLAEFKTHNVLIIPESPSNPSPSQPRKLQSPHQSNRHPYVASPNQDQRQHPETSLLVTRQQFIPPNSITRRRRVDV